MSELPAELKYLSSHEWARVEDDVVTIGISDHAQKAMGDLVFVELPDVGADLHANDEAGVVESVLSFSFSCLFSMNTSFKKFTTS